MIIFILETNVELSTYGTALQNHNHLNSAVELHYAADTCVCKHSETKASSSYAWKDMN